MRLTRKLFLLAITMIAALAMTATAASAQSVEVEQEANPALHCPAIQPVGNHTITGGCEFHATGRAVFTQHTGVHETPFSDCASEFSGIVNENGFGYIDDQLLSSPNCGITPCDEEEGTAIPHAELLWPMIIFEGETESHDSTEGLATTMCIRGLTQIEGPGIFCTFTIDMYTNPVTGHPVEFEAEDILNPELDGESCENPVIELNGHWTVESSEAVVHHTP